MKPAKLELKGFTCFREKCEIDFSRFDLFAITGQTGAGKTSLLDAMTFALYGKTARLGKAGRELISQGAVGLSVTLRFRSGAEEYRVTRAIDSTSAHARLERIESGKWVTVSGSNTEVGNRVEQIIGLDFDAFMKAVILPQGKFDQFLRGGRAEQRKTLDDLLDMQVYKRMAQLAGAKKASAAELAAAKRAELDASGSTEAKTDSERDLGRLTGEEERAAEAVEVLRQALPEAVLLREKRKQRQALDAQWRRVQAALAESGEAPAYDHEAHLRLAAQEQLALRRERLAAQLAECERKKAAEMGALRSAEAEVERAGAAREDAARGIADTGTAREKAVAAYEELRERHGSEDAIGAVVIQYEQAEASARAIPNLERTLGELAARVQGVAAECEAARAAVAAAEGELEAARADYEHWHARDRAAALRNELAPGESCPVCEQVVHTPPLPLDAGELARARNRADAAEVAVRKIRGDLAAAQAEAVVLPRKIELVRRERDVCLAVVERAEEARRRVCAGQGMARQSASALPHLAQLVRNAHVAAREAQADYERAMAIEQRTSRAHFDALQRHNSLSIQVTALDSQIASLRQELGEMEATPPVHEIQAALQSMNAARQKSAELESLRAQEARCTAAIGELDPEMETLTAGLRARAGNADPAMIEQLHAAAQKDLDAARSQLERCRMALHDLDQKIARNRRLAQEIERHSADEAVYRELATWLNGANFQQYLMNSAFELLAHEGSRHLKELSNGRYTFLYNETEFKVIDRWNGDEPRSVNTLSGGESFLASLALALALAESIAELNSAGGATALESLFLDEGFSTLDAETQSRVADAMQVLQGGKRLIGIITHVQTLADQMPFRIEIERTPTGSRIRQPLPKAASHVT
jgi:exonuclease SbcC